MITSAGLILAGTFLVLTLLPLEQLFQLGFAVALGVLVDTFVVRSLLVPAIASCSATAPGGRRVSAGERSGRRAILVNTARCACV